MNTSHRGSTCVIIVATSDHSDGNGDAARRHDQSRGACWIAQQCSRNSGCRAMVLSMPTPNAMIMKGCRREIAISSAG